MQLYRLSIQKEFCIFELYLASFKLCLYTCGVYNCMSFRPSLMLLRLHCIALKIPTEYLLIKLTYNTTVVMQVASQGKGQGVCSVLSIFLVSFLGNIFF